MLMVTSVSVWQILQGEDAVFEDGMMTSSVKKGGGGEDFYKDEWYFVEAHQSVMHESATLEYPDF